jgi:hypothetical protein
VVGPRYVQFEPSPNQKVWASIGGETWFQLGDGDLALHVERTRRLASGESLSSITAEIARRLGIEAARCCAMPVFQSLQ